MSDEEAESNEEQDDDLAFILDDDEELILDDYNILYTGSKITTRGYVAGGILAFGLGGGLTRSTQKKVRGGMFDREQIHLYLTNKRLVSALRADNYTINSEIPLPSIVGFSTDQWIDFLGDYQGGELDISVKYPTGEIDSFTLSFFNLGKEEGYEEELDGSDRRDTWLNLIKEQMNNLKKISRPPSSTNTHIETLKGRLARGEITIEQYKELIEILVTPVLLTVEEQPLLEDDTENEDAEEVVEENGEQEDESAIDGVNEDLKKRAEVSKNQGNGFYNVGNYRDAIYHYDKALEIYPEYAGVWNNKAMALAKLGRTDEAKECEEKAAYYKKE
jgi:tetratricopeptide (TPR) repeat protein